MSSQRVIQGLVLPSFVLTLAACPPREEPVAVDPGQTGTGTGTGTGQDHFPVKITDDLNRTVALARTARRIASLSPSNTEILHAVGCGLKIVLRDRNSDYPPSVKRTPATNSFAISLEHVAGFSPDLVLLSHAAPDRLKALQRIGINAASFDPHTLHQLYANILAIGALCGARAAAKALVARLRRRVEDVARTTRGRTRPTVYIETDGADPRRPWSAGPGSFVHAMVSLAGGQNILNDLKRPFAQVNAEEIFARRPRVILLMGVDQSARSRGAADLGKRPGWKHLIKTRAVKVVSGIHPDLLSRPGPRLVDGLEALARALHPEPAP